MFQVRALVIKQRVPVPANSIAARCGEGEVTVEVKQNFLGNVVFNPQLHSHSKCLLLYV